MVAIVPSYLAKVHRAEKHIIDLEGEIERYASTKPYTVRERIEGKKQRKVRRLAFTAYPENTDIPIIIADVIYNLRSSLDHLMAALVAPKDRSSSMFPIFFQGVWEAIAPGENQQRVKERIRWASDIKTIDSGAVAVLQSLQPPDDGGNNETANLLRFINRLSNRDRHEKPPVVVTGLDQLVARFKWPDGRPQIGLGIPNSDGGFFKDGAEIKFPQDAMDVEIEGTPLIAIRVGQDETGRPRYLQVPDELTKTVSFIKNMVIAKLAAFTQ